MHWAKRRHQDRSQASVDAATLQGDAPMEATNAAVFLWCSFDFPLVFLWLSFGVPFAFLGFSFGVPLASPWFCLVSFGFVWFVMF